MILEWHLVLKLSLGFAAMFVGKHPNFHSKDACYFLLFYSNEEESIQQVCLRKYTENEIFNYTSHKTKKQKKRCKNII